MIYIAYLLVKSFKTINFVLKSLNSLGLILKGLGLGLEKSNNLGLLFNLLLEKFNVFTLVGFWSNLGLGRQFRLNREDFRLQFNFWFWCRIQFIITFLAIFFILLEFFFLFRYKATFTKGYFVIEIFLEIFQCLIVIKFRMGLIKGFLKYSI